MRFYSIIIPVYNRPNEIDELLNSLIKQTFTNFEVLIIEDGSEEKCETIVESYKSRLNINYFFKPNSGQGFSRNFGFEKALGDYFVVFDSDCLIPEDYFERVEAHLNKDPLAAFGGPDKAHSSFTPMQKAISYSMTSPFTTGGIRGNKAHSGVFHPRSFNMGISKEVFDKTEGYKISRMGEDIELSLRIIENGFKTGLIPEAFVYHKRRTSLKQFYNQLHFFGRARVNVKRFYPKELKLVHLLPLFFVLALVAWGISYFVFFDVFLLGSSLLGVFSLAILVDSTIKNSSLSIGFLSIATSFTQLIAYGIGMIQESFRTD
jgi:glycosyltransferase involved in cell wall biosynthesis